MSCSNSETSSKHTRSSVPLSMTSRLVVGLSLALAFATTAARRGDLAGWAPVQDDAALVARARAIHERVLTLDTHNDIDPDQFTPSCNYTMRLTTQVNLPKMREGGLDVSFMIVYVGQGAVTTQGC